MRRFAALVILTVGAACNSVCGIDQKTYSPPVDPDVNPNADDDAANDSAVEPTLLDAEVDVLEDDGGLDAGIDCLGVRRNAFFCDGFEGATIAASWTKVEQPDISKAKVQLTTSRFLAGGKSLVASLDPLTPNSKAKLTFARPGGAGILAAQVSVFVADDAESPGQDVPLFTLRGGAKTASLFAARLAGSTSRFELRFTGAGAPATLVLGPVVFSTWQCVELEQNAGAVTAYVGATKIDTRVFAAEFDTVEVGVEWPFSGGAFSKAWWFDEVVIAPQRIGCLHP